MPKMRGFGFRAAAGETFPGGGPPMSACHLFAGRFDGGTGFLAGVWMEQRWRIPWRNREHGIEHGGLDGRGGVEIEVDAFILLPTGYYERGIVGRDPCR